MINKNNKGFTLLELLVSICILSTVIFIGYKIIDTSTKSVKDQGNVNKGQLTMNDMNNYLTKDLEQSSEVILDLFLLNKEKGEEIESKKGNYELSIIDNEFDSLVSKIDINNMVVYKYTIKSNNYIDNNLVFDDKKIIAQYSIKVEIDKKRQIYSITRKDFNNVEVEFVHKERLKDSKAPFTIKGSNPYKVDIQYNGKNNKTVKHEFEVASRYLTVTNEDGEDSNPSIPKPPNGIDIPKGYDAIGFWTADKSKCIKNLYTWINGELSNPGYQEINKEDRFNINANNSNNGNSGHTWAKIGYENNDWKASKNKETTIKPKEIKEVFIYVSKNSELSSVKDNNNTIIGVKDINKSTSGYNLSGGDNGTLYECVLASKNKTSFDLNGILSIDKEKVDSGFVIVLYGSAYI